MFEHKDQESVPHVSHIQYCVLICKKCITTNIKLVFIAGLQNICGLLGLRGTELQGQRAGFVSHGPDYS